MKTTDALPRGALAERAPSLLSVTHPDGSVTSYAIPETGEIVIGRDPSMDVAIDDGSVSRRHAVVRAGKPPTIEDLNSRNGTRVSGIAVTARSRAPIPVGSIIEVGNVIALVRSSNVLEEAPQLERRKPTPTTAIVEDATMKELYALVDIVGPSRMSVLVLGETGVGKDVYAEQLHRASERAKKPFLRINCAALPESLLEAELFGHEKGAFTGAVAAKPGLFESADGGTVFLDEVGEISLATQAKLLRFLESGEVLRVGGLRPKHVDIRIVAATNRDLETACAEGDFRNDLYYRLNGISVTLPPLRERGEDIMPLAEHFAKRAAGKTARAPKWTAAARAALAAHPWPGNIRELRSAVERAVLMARGDELRPEHFQLTRVARGTAAPPVVSSKAGATESMHDEIAAVEKRRILDAMATCGGNQSRAAKMLGLARGTLIKRLEEYGYVRPRKGD